MVDKEMLQAMRDMMKEEMTANNASLRQEMGQMMDEKLAEQEKRTDKKFNGVMERLDTMQTDITAMQEDIAEIKEDTAITRSATNSLVKWADDVSVLTQIKFPVKEAK